ncbi:unnamed protein product [Phytophthora fragariaefolia]|uniref:Unnamed protein product n=1 Tax=Phytophthora fragariaefolia TaxID=1490495 RepID=A0A9W6WY07_9STRA|nr:unnamed protein product [Phytophthora fragariaefolia]
MDTVPPLDSAIATLGSQCSERHRTVVFIYGNQFTRARISEKKATYRCSGYRQTGCKAKAEFKPEDGIYVVVRPHKCRFGVAEAGTVLDVMEERKQRVDILVITEMACTARNIWDYVNQEFYVEAASDKATVGRVSRSLCACLTLGRLTSV